MNVCCTPSERLLLLKTLEQCSPKRVCAPDFSLGHSFMFHILTKCVSYKVPDILVQQYTILISRIQPNSSCQYFWPLKGRLILLFEHSVQSHASSVSKFPVHCNIINTNETLCGVPLHVHLFSEKVQTQRQKHSKEQLFSIKMILSTMEKK